jgi:hypothetical protein
MSAARALWVRQRVDARPAATTDHASLVTRERPLAHDTHSRQQQIGDASRGSAEHADRQAAAQRCDRVKLW